MWDMTSQSLEEPTLLTFCAWNSKIIKGYISFVDTTKSDVNCYSCPSKLAHIICLEFISKVGACVCVCGICVWSERIPITLYACSNH